jgi:hypothetical protein
MFIAVRRASAIVDTIGLTPEQLGMPLVSAIRPARRVVSRRECR